MSNPSEGASLWQWPELCAALGLPEMPGPNVTGIAIDSRLVAPGDLFVALKGDPGPRFTATDRSDRDGYDYVPAALSAGAVGAIVSRAHPGLTPERTLQVADTLDALWQLGAARRNVLRGPVVAVTGSSGKTTCKTFLKAALSAYASEGSLNNHIGVPLSLARTPASARACVYELGMNHPGEIAPLSALVRPELAVVLNVHDAHAEAFSNREAIAQEKLSISAGLEGRRIVVVEDRIDTSALSASLTFCRFGESDGADVRLLEVRADQARYQLGGEELHARVPGGGHHRALTLAAVLAVLQQLGLPLEPVTRLSSALVPAGRGNRSLHAGVELIDDSYNANPASMAAALRALGEESGDRYALIGEMLELGEQGPAQHLALAPLCAQLSGVALVGEGMAELASALPASLCLGWWPEVSGDPGEELKKILLNRLREGDKLLIKGSNRVFWKHQFAKELAAVLDLSTSVG